MRVCMRVSIRVCECMSGYVRVCMPTFLVTHIAHNLTLQMLNSILEPNVVKVLVLYGITTLCISIEAKEVKIRASVMCCVCL